MKKGIALIIAVMLLLTITSAALAADVTASYENGMLTVSTSTDGWFRISVDGAGTGRSLTPNVPTLTFEIKLSNGLHTVNISSDTSGGGTTQFMVTDAAPAEPTPTAAPSNPVVQPTYDPTDAENIPNTPSALPTGIPANAVSTRVKVTPKPATCIASGISSTGQTVPALGHCYGVISTNNGLQELRCIRCGRNIQAALNEQIANRFGNILVNNKSRNLGYNARVTLNVPKTVVITIKRPSSGVVLTLDSTLLALMNREGYERIQLINDNANLIIELNQINSTWFPDQEGIVSYLFTLNSTSARSTYKVEAMLDNGQKVESRTYYGVYLK